MTALHIHNQAPSVDGLQFERFAQHLPEPEGGECVIEVQAAGVNMSDVKATLGQMPHAVWPRTPGRDYAGVVIRGPANLHCLTFGTRV